MSSKESRSNACRLDEGFGISMHSSRHSPPDSGKVRRRSLARSQLQPLQILPERPSQVPPPQGEFHRGLQKPSLSPRRNACPRTIAVYRRWRNKCSRRP